MLAFKMHFDQMQKKNN